MVVNILRCQFGCCWCPQRYVLCFMSLMGIMNGYCMRTCLNLALTEMVVVKHHKIDANQCPGNVTSAVQATEGKYRWTESQQHLILGIFYYGYVVTHPIGGFLADKIGGRHVFSQCVFLSGVLTILIPVSVDKGGWQLLAAARFIVGCSQGMLFPAVSTLLAKWVPKKERSILGSIVMSAPHIGSVIGYYVTARLISDTHSWRIVYYFWGTSALVWYVFFIVLCYSEPATHPHMTFEEAEYLDKEIGKTPKLKVPWLAILFDRGVLAMLFGGIGHDYMFFLLATELPKYMKDVLMFDVEKSGALNAFPYVLLWLLSIISGFIATWLVNKEMLSVTNVRKIMTTVGSMVPSLCIVAGGYFGCNKAAAATMFFLGLGFIGPYYAGMRVNMLDLSQNFCGIIQGYVNGGGALAFAPFPNLIALIAPNNTIDEWRVVFWVVFGVAQVTNVIYIVWGSGERAQWDHVTG